MMITLDQSELKRGNDGRRKITLERVKRETDEETNQERKELHLNLLVGYPGMSSTTQASDHMHTKMQLDLIRGNFFETQIYIFKVRHIQYGSKA